MTELSAGTPPERVILEGRYCRLEPMAARHVPALHAATAGDGEVQARYRYFPIFPPVDEADLLQRTDAAAHLTDRLVFAVVDRETGLCGGQQSLMNIAAANRSIEIGAVLWGSGVARTRIATEALYLMACYVFERLQYRRFEWKCNNLNEASKNAALRFGFSFEGVFRQHMIAKGENRDTAWFSIIDGEWPGLKVIYEAWLDPANFDRAGIARTRLGTIRR